MAGMDQKDLALCWLSCCVPLIVGRPKDFLCGGDYTGAVLDKVIVCFTGAVIQTVLSGQTVHNPQVQLWFVVPVECRHGPDSEENRGVLHAVLVQVVGLPVVCNDSGLVQTLSLEVPQLQLFFKDPVVAQRLSPRRSLRFTQLPYIWWLMFLLCSFTGAVRGGGRRCVHAATSSLCWMGLRFVHRHLCRARLRGFFCCSFAAFFRLRPSER